MPIARVLVALVVTSACSHEPDIRPDDRAGEVAEARAGVRPRVVQIALGRYHACSLSADGVVRCVGRNDYGQLGDGTVDDRQKPVRVVGLSDAVEVAVGDYHTCARRSDRTVVCWGYDAAGQLGDGTRVDRSVPWPVQGIDDAEELALGAHHSCVRTVEGDVWCFGYSADGELGDGSTSDRPLPVRVLLPRGGARRVVAGSFHTCALGDGGGVRCWGSNMAGQLGDGTMNNRPEPVPTRGIERAVDIALGFAHTCVRGEDDAVSCFGANFQGQLGDGTHEARLEPTRAVELRGRVRGLALGFSHTCALLDDGRVRCVGDVHAPFDRDLDSVTELVAGGPSTCAVLHNGAIRCDAWELHASLF